VIDRNRPIPLYYQLELLLREQIDAGAWTSGTRVPAESDLAKRYGVSRITVRMALERLEDDGLIERQRGRGTFVHANAGALTKIERDPGNLFAFEEDILRQGFEPTTRVLAIEEGPPPARLGWLLRLDPDESAVRLRRLGSADGQPLWLESRYFPLAIGRSLQSGDLTTPSISRLIEATCGRQITSTRLRIGAAAATATQAHQLDTTPGAPMLLNEFVFYDQQGSPVQALHAFFRADRYAFIFNVSSPAVAQRKEAGTAGLARAGRGWLDPDEGG